jgi:hypothetical protein
MVMLVLLIRSQTQTAERREVITETITARRSGSDEED